MFIDLTKLPLSSEEIKEQLKDSLAVDFGIKITTSEGVFKKMEGTALRRVKERTA